MASTHASVNAAVHGCLSRRAHCGAAPSVRAYDGRPHPGSLRRQWTGCYGFLDNNRFQWNGGAVPTTTPAVAAIADPSVAVAALDPARARLLAALVEPASATALARRVGMSRQLVNHHLRTLERHGLVELVEERRKGNMTERVVRATAGSWVISPDLLGGAAPDPPATGDRLSAAYLLAVGARLVAEVGRLVTGAAAARKRVSTLALDTEVRFASAADRAAFAQELTAAVSALVARYHDEDAEGGRRHRLVLGVHPLPPPPAAPTPEEDAPE